MPDFDIIVYGASGFTGTLVAEYMHATYPQASWAIAGRNLDKLAEVHKELGLPKEVEMIRADASDPRSLEDLAKRAKVIITTVGPYQLYGEPLVEACVKTGTDYVDLCGEPPFMWQMIERHDEAAKASGARIIHSCGFDSIPPEMGVFFLQAEAVARFGKPLKDVKGRVRSMKGTSSGGTVASGRETMKAAMGNPETMKRLLSSFALTPGFEGPKQPYGNKP
ncbi:MAG: saccharopine dehydrogenase NADP-binding domain-containing protein, partial [Pseudomonadota bacterium]